MHALKLLLVSCLVALLAAGCGGSSSPSPSNTYATNAIYAFMKAVQDESGNVTTTVQLRDGVAPTAQYLYLAGADVLYTSLDEPPKNFMNFSGNLFSNSLILSQRLKVASSRNLFNDYILFTKIVTGKPEYFSIDTPVAGSSPVRAYVDLERAGHVFTGESFVDLPLAFSITAPASAASVQRSANLVLSWTNVDATTTMKLDVAGICDDGSRYNLSHVIGTDTGSATLNSTDYFPATGTSPSTNCRVAFMLQRVRTSGISPNFALGTFEGVQQRAIQFTTIP